MSKQMRDRIVLVLNRIPVNVAVIGLCMIWLIPTLGLFVTSFRPQEAVTKSGWWTALSSTEADSTAYDQSCAGCHGADLKGVDGVDLSDSALITDQFKGNARRVQLIFRGELENGDPHVPEDMEPSDPAQAATEILAYLEAQTGAGTERFTLNNYEDVLVGYDARGGTYEEACDTEGPTGTRSCEFWKDATRQGAIFRGVLNSFAVSIPATLLPILFAGFAAYAFAWLDFSGRKVLFTILVGLQIVPLQMTLVPIFRLYAQLGLNGSFLGVWLFHTGFGLPYAIYLMRNFIATLPRDLFESAYLDGAGHFQVFRKIVLPLALPAIAALGIFQFLWVWNDLLVALIFLGNKAPVLTYQLSQLVDSLGGGWHRMTAAAFISMAVPVIVFLAFQRFFVRGLLAGSVKG
ncbi:MAG TPA: ABC transporter permease subunit [Aggregatilinea sp.]|uniref:ABC transporter permease subunit n=1 Tax=Aggregatilinea sp. TaxID=2806333 RepID=UPI002BD16008|nr:ABC transporter permease subunit [Aggregatilinea sp.]HML20112.1 ABC transporter permease subunit [Aggregatilinea sp.]